MSADQNPLIDDLTNRQLIAQMTAEDDLHAHLNEQSRVVYCGFDPTADSLHIGSLVPLLALRRFQQAGHKPIALVGGATGMIGDPSFKAAERKLNTPEIIQEWTEKIRQQVSRFIDFDSGVSQARVVNNYEWTKQLDVLTFLRDVGKHFAVNMMINKESVKQRIQREGEGISYTEFSYMLLQSYDFAELYKQYGCTMQLGGSDQWGNITGGIDLTRRLHHAQVYGLTLPLITKSDGTKFGKTETGTIWLDANRTSPYAFYQFWINTADADVYRFLRYFTFLPIEEIVQIEVEDAQAQGPKQAQKILAREVTRLVHGEDGYKAAERISQALFSGELGSLSEDDLLQLKQDGLPCTVLGDTDFKEKSLIQLCVESELASSGKAVKDALGRKAVLVNGHPLTMDDNMKIDEVFSRKNALYGRFFITRMGKKKYHLFESVC
ncbi:tyrosine--tRNA ligase [Zooshikella harenae]|uniref:Tyrosine--tRNA ligase n=1 Tax=Zooshikella harenae TaxID=2827238 RepID=A0ABS5Z9S5_9GAMM|nr:tyrosine--tRNA ligase [Zooshikella harenae]MBU2710508.1 tyrosine--tRNA ligase [Zooshikella harenae]